MAQTPVQTSDQNPEGEERGIEMWYNTWGSFGQHDAQHYIVCDTAGCYDEIGALQRGLVELVANLDSHSRKNYHYHRFYTFDPRRVSAVIRLKCYASASRHLHEAEVVYGEAKISSVLDESGEAHAYMITLGDRKYIVDRCVRGLRLSIQDYNAILERERQRQERERQKLERPTIVLAYDGKKLRISGDTYYHRETLKQIARLVGLRLLWDGTSKQWYVDGVGERDVDVIADEIKKAIPGAELRIAKNRDDRGSEGDTAS